MNAPTSTHLFQSINESLKLVDFIMRALGWVLLPLRRKICYGSVESGSNTTTTVHHQIVPPTPPPSFARGDADWASDSAWWLSSAWTFGVAQEECHVVEYWVCWACLHSICPNSPCGRHRKVDVVLLYHWRWQTSRQHNHNNVMVSFTVAMVSSPIAFLSLTIWKGLTMAAVVTVKDKGELQSSDPYCDRG